MSDWIKIDEQNDRPPQRVPVWVGYAGKVDKANSGQTLYDAAHWERDRKGTPLWWNAPLISLNMAKISRPTHYMPIAPPVRE